MIMLPRKQCGVARPIILSAVISTVVLIAVIYIGLAMASSSSFKYEYNRGVANFKDSQLPFVVTRDEMSSGIFSSVATLELKPDPIKFPDYDGQNIIIETNASHGPGYDSLAGVSVVRADIYSALSDTGITKDSKPILNYAKGFGDHKFEGKGSGFTDTFTSDEETFTLSVDSGISFNGKIDGDQTLTMQLRVPGITLDGDSFNARINLGEVNATIPRTDSAFSVGDFEMLMGSLKYKDKIGDGAEDADFRSLRVASSSAYKDGLHSAEAIFFAENTKTEHDPAGDASVKITYENVPESFFATMQALSENEELLADDAQMRAIMMEVLQELHRSGASVSIWPAQYTTEAGSVEFRTSLGLSKPSTGQTQPVTSMSDLLQSLMVQAEMDIDKSLIEEFDAGRGSNIDGINTGALADQMAGLASEGIFVRDGNRYSSTLELNNNRLKINNQDAPEIMGLLLLLAGGGLE